MRGGIVMSGAIVSFNVISVSCDSEVDELLLG